MEQPTTEQDVQQESTQEQLSELLQIRRDKLTALQQAGKDPFWNTTFDVSHYSTDVMENRDALLDASAAPDLPLLCALCSFGGLSILMQNLLFLGKSIRPGKLLLLRLLHGAAAYGVCRMLVRLFPFFL